MNKKIMWSMIGIVCIVLLSSCKQIPVLNGNEFKKDYASILNEDELTLLEMTYTYSTSGGQSLSVHEGTEVLNFYENATTLSAEIENKSIYESPIYVKAIIEDTEEGLVYLERIGLSESNSQPFVLTPFSEDSFLRNQDQTSDIIFHLNKYEAKELKDNTYKIEVPVQDLYEHYRDSLLIIENLFGIEITEEDVYNDKSIVYTVTIDQKNETVSMDIDMDDFLEKLNTKICKAYYGEEAEMIDCDEKNYYLDLNIEVEKLEEAKSYKRPNYIEDDAPSNIYYDAFMDTLELGDVTSFSKDYEYDLEYIKIKIEEAGQYRFESTNPNIILNVYDEGHSRKNTPTYWMYDLMDTNQLTIYLEPGSYIIECDPTHRYGVEAYNVTYSKIEEDDKINVLKEEHMTPIFANQEVTFLKEYPFDTDTIVFESNVDSVSFILEEGLDFYTERGIVDYVQVNNDTMYVRVDQTEGGAIDLTFYQSREVDEYRIYFTEIDNSIDPLDLDGDVNQSIILGDETIDFVSFGNPGPGDDNELYKLVVEKDCAYMLYSTDSYFSIYNSEHELLYDGYEETSMTFSEGTYYLNIHDFTKMNTIVRLTKAYFDIENELEVVKRDGAFTLNGIVSHHGDEDRFFLTVEEEGIYLLDMNSEAVTGRFWFSKVGTNNGGFYMNNATKSAYVTLTPGQYKLESEYMTSVGETYYISFVETNKTDIEYEGDYTSYTINQSESTTFTISLDSLTDTETMSFIINQPTGFTLDFTYPYVNMKRTFIDEGGNIDVNDQAGGLYSTYENGTVEFEFSLNPLYIDSHDLYGEYEIEVSIRLLD